LPSFGKLVEWLVVSSVPRAARCIEGANGKHSPRTDLFSASFGLATGISRPRPVMLFNLFSLAIKIPLNAVFMCGLLGDPR
jgi:hypothetical protein